MSYRILYSPEKQNRYPMVQRRKNNIKRILAIFVITMIFATLLSGSGKAISEFLIPGDAEQFREAASTMINKIQTGTSVKDAVTAFCVEIVGYGLQES